MASPFAMGAAVKLESDDSAFTTVKNTQAPQISSSSLYIIYIQFVSNILAVQLNIYNIYKLYIHYN